MALRAEVVAVGDELLSGAGVNGNAAWLGARLGEVDVAVVHGTVVGDDPEVIADAILAATARADLVVLTGGLGPTSDDRTRDALALVLGGGLRRDPAHEQVLREFAAARGRVADGSSLRQADVPVGATTLANPVGAAPGLRAEVDGATVVCLPGIPAEMRAIVDAVLVPELAARSAGTAAVAVLRTTLVGETVVAAALADVEARAVAAGVRVAYLPSPAQVAVRFVAPPLEHGGPSGAERLAPLVAAAERALGDLVAVRGPWSLADEVLRRAREASTTFAVAESVTGGMVAAALTDVPGASHALLGGVVAYATASKAVLLGVDPALLARVGAVDPQVALQMADGVRARFGAEHGVATTGVAGPEPQDGRAPGTVHVAVAGPAGRAVASPVLFGDRDRVRAQAVVHALDLLRRSVAGRLPDGADG